MIHDLNLPEDNDVSNRYYGDLRDVQAENEKRDTKIRDY